MESHHFLCVLLFIALVSPQCSIQGCSSCANSNQCSICNEGSGYYLSDSKGCGTCGQVIQKCLTCIVVSGQTECIQCESAYGASKNVCCDLMTTFPDGNGGCQSCSPGCLACTGPESPQYMCFLCDTFSGYVASGMLCCDTRNGQYPDGPDTCSNCQTLYPFCSECVMIGESVKCLSCSGSRYAENNVCKDCMENCLACKDGNSCEQCKNGFEKKGSGCECPVGTFESQGTCSNCVSNCDVCSDSSSCTTCSGGFEKIGNGCECPVGTFESQGTCSNCVSNCDVCSDSSSCTTCSGGFEKIGNGCECPVGTFESQGTCSNCVSNCDVCSDSSSCTTCSGGFEKIGNGCECPVGTFESQGTCSNCVSNCDVCSDSSSCTTCSGGFEKIGNGCECPVGTFESQGTCSNCVSNCDVCSDSSSCTTCSGGFEKIGNGCECPVGTFESQGTCSNCVSNCDVCSDSSSCTTCSGGFEKIGNGCECPVGTFESQGTCSNCVSNCDVCSDSSSCTTCSGGFEKIGNGCECPVGTFESQGTCSNCVSNCDVCSDSSSCTTCSGGFEKIGNGCECPVGTFESQGTCSNCVSNCDVCSDSSSCTTCSGGFEKIGNGCECPVGTFESQGTCSNCVSNCDVCSDSSSCTTCSGGFEKIGNGCECPVGTFESQGTCSNCVSNCDVCSDSSSCTTCSGGFEKIGNGCECPVGTFESQGTCSNCVSNCDVCSDSSSCTTCSGGFEKIGNGCECPVGTFESQGTCSNCVSNCDVCSDSSSCTTCSGGFEKIGNGCECPVGTFESQGTCSNCVSNCDVCSDSSSCTTCSGGFEKIGNGCECPVGTFESQGTCSNCVSNCDVCSDSSSCTTCSGGFQTTLQGLCSSLPPISLQSPFGLKSLYSLTQSRCHLLNRQVTSILLAQSYSFINILYSGLTIYFYPQESHVEGKYISDMDFHAESSLLAVSSYNKKIALSTISVGNVEPSKFIETDSQVLEVDFNSNGHLLSGHMNGDLKLFSPDSSYSTQQVTISHKGGRVEGAKLCDDGRILTVVEENGFFTFRMFSSTGELLDEEELTEELIDVHLDATDDCSSVCLASTYQMKVQVFRQQGQSYTLFAELPETGPVGKASIHPDGDVIVVPLLISQSTKVYKYNSCIGQIQLVDTLTTAGDPSVSAINEDRVAVGTVDGNVSMYTQTVASSQCDPTGKKVNFTLSQLPPMSTSRPVTHLHLSGNLLLTTEKHSTTQLFEVTTTQLIPLDSFSPDTFISDGDINSLHQCFVLASHQKTAFIYKKQTQDYDLFHTIALGSQATSVDMSDNDCAIVLGHKDGSVTVHQPTDYDTPTISIINQGCEVFETKICVDNSVLAVVEKAGEFFFRYFDSQGTQVQEIAVEEELIQVFMGVGGGCEIVVLGGVTMGSVKVLKLSQGSYVENEVIPDGYCLSAVSINPQADLILLSRIADEQQSVLYRFSLCSNRYMEERKIESGDFDQFNAVSDEFILQSNEAGNIQAHTYTWQFQPVCPAPALAVQSYSIRNNSQSNSPLSEQKLSSVHNISLRKDEKSQGSMVGMTAGVALLALLVGIICKYRGCGSGEKEKEEVRGESQKYLSTQA